MVSGTASRTTRRWARASRSGRAVIRVGDALPGDTCLEANAHALGRYAALCQEQGLVPIVEPEVLMDGAHRLARTGELTSAVLDRVFRVLSTRRVSLEGMLLKPNMVVPGTECPEPVSVTEVATATLSVLRRHVPAAVPGIVVSLRSAGRPACHRAPERHERRPWNAPVARQPPTAAPCRIRPSRRGAAGRRVSRPGSRRSTIGSAATARRASAPKRVDGARGPGRRRCRRPAPTDRTTDHRLSALPRGDR